MKKRVIKLLMVGKSGIGKTVFVTKLYDDKAVKVLKKFVGSVQSTLAKFHYAYNDEEKTSDDKILLEIKIKDIRVEIERILKDNMIKILQYVNSKKIKNLDVKSLYEDSGIVIKDNTTAIVAVIKDSVVLENLYMLTEKHIDNFKKASNKNELEDEVVKYVRGLLKNDIEVKNLMDLMIKDIEDSFEKECEKESMGSKTEYKKYISLNPKESIKEDMILTNNNIKKGTFKKSLHTFISDIYVYAPVKEQLKQLGEFEIIDYMGVDHLDNDFDFKKIKDAIYTNEIHHCIVALDQVSTKAGDFSTLVTSIKALDTNISISIIKLGTDKFFDNTDDEDEEEYEEQVKLLKENIKGEIDQIEKINNIAEKKISINLKVYPEEIRGFSLNKAKSIEKRLEELGIEEEVKRVCGGVDEQTIFMEDLLQYLIKHMPKIKLKCGNEEFFERATVIYREYMDDEAVKKAIDKVSEKLFKQVYYVEPNQDIQALIKDFLENGNYTRARVFHHKTEDAFYYYNSQGYPWTSKAEVYARMTFIPCEEFYRVVSIIINKAVRIRTRELFNNEKLEEYLKIYRQEYKNYLNTFRNLIGKKVAITYSKYKPGTRELEEYNSYNVYDVFDNYLRNVNNYEYWEDVIKFILRDINLYIFNKCIVISKDNI